MLKNSVGCLNARASETRRWVASCTYGGRQLPCVLDQLRSAASSWEHHDPPHDDGSSSAVIDIFAELVIALCEVSFASMMPSANLRSANLERASYPTGTV